MPFYRSKQALFLAFCLVTAASIATITTAQQQNDDDDDDDDGPYENIMGRAQQQQQQKDDDDDHPPLDAPLLAIYESVMDPPLDDPSDYTIHDPSRIITVGNYQLIAVTGKAQEDGYDCGLETWWRNKGDRGNWKPGQCLFRKGNKPAWVAAEAELNDGAYWAPELHLRDDGSLALLYSVSEMDEREGGPNTCVGIARSVHGTSKGFPDGLAWTDSGDALACIHGSDYPDEERSAIDPSVFWGMGDDDGRLFLVTGGGVVVGTELDPSTYEQKNGEWYAPGHPEWHDLARGPPSEDGDEDGGGGHSWVEAAYVHPNPDTGYYYLFVNWGACCSGLDSTYQIRVGRSRSPMGPYLDKKGKNLPNEFGGSLLLKSGGNLIGPGHAGVVTRGQKDYLSFHYYDKRRQGNSWIAEKRLKWNRKGWPRLKRKARSSYPKDLLLD